MNVGVPGAAVPPGAGAGAGPGAGVEPEAPVPLSSRPVPAEPLAFCVYQAGGA
ncbi:hypothetical protein [Streptomyces sp. NPDC048002]|uniref:hypothetical protein n=1 Tax=Streptomyces sp. NPDC048002 TaxID=3154344 RepID=UPI0033FF6773